LSDARKDSHLTFLVTHTHVTLFVITPYFLDPSASGAQFARFMLLVVLLAYCGQGIGLVVSCGIASRMLAMVVTPLAIAPFILFTPYAVDIDSLPGYFVPFQVGSPFWASRGEETDGWRRAENRCRVA
jgi:hypothetical protein